MTRRLLTLLSAVSLLLCAATCMLWVRSYRHLDEAGRPAGGDFVHAVTSHRGTLQLRCRLDAVASGPAERRTWRAFSPADVAALSADADDVDDPDGDQSLFILPVYTGVFTDRADVLGFGLYDTDPSRSWVRYGAGGILRPPAERWRVIRFPHWCPASLATALPAWWASAALRRHRRTRSGLCLACGYDLRATPEKGGALLDRCPECGAVPATPPV